MHLATNEALCLTLADACRLPTATCRLVTTAGRTSVAIDRYDRQYVDGDVIRLHQEDVLSALGRDPWLKYERGNAIAATDGDGFGTLTPVRNDPGPTLDEIAALIEQHLGQATLIRLAEIVAFNVAIGNADAHARNLSLLLKRDGTVSLAPLYDLVSTRYYDSLDSTAAQYVNGVNEIDDISVDDIGSHAAEWGLPNRVLQRVPKLLQIMAERLDLASRRVVDLGGDQDIARELTESIRRRMKRMS